MQHKIAFDLAGLMLELLHLRWTGETVSCYSPVVWRFLGELQECFNSTTRGYTMPAFTFEKIPPPVQHGPIPPIVKKPRGVIVQILGRLVEARAKRTLRGDKGVIARNERKPTE
jgi:hypothetical protein